MPLLTASARALPARGRVFQTPTSLAMTRNIARILAATRQRSGKRFPASPRGAPAGTALKPGDVVGTGSEALVFIAENSDSVIKRFFKADSTLDRVRCEAERLILLNKSLHTAPAQVRFPKVVALRPESLEIEMQFAPGSTLLRAAEEGSLPDEVGRVVANGLAFYHKVIGHAFHDFAPVNAIWDQDRKEVWFIDVASPHHLPEPACESLLPVLSLAYYLGSVAYEVARPKSPQKWRVMKSQAAFVRALWTEFFEMGIRVPRQYLVDSSLDRYRISAYAGSSVWRRAWYDTLGLVLARIFIHAAVAGLSGTEDVHRS